MPRQPPATFPDPKVETPKAILTSAHKELGAAAATGSALAKEIITKNEDELREAKAAAAAPAPSAPVVVDADYDEPVTYSRITKLADLNIQTDSKQSQDLINQPDSLRFDAMLELARETKEIKTIPIVDVEPDVTKDPDETSSPEEETEENALPQYRVRLVVEGKRLTSVKKQLRTMFPALSPDDIEVEKIDGRASRMDRLCEAISLVNDAKETVDELAQELQEWHDNLPGNLQSGEKASELEEAINSLESLSSELENINWDVEFPSMM
jgi:DNA repair exonuclease SbcCD ATPase subunit